MKVKALLEAVKFYKAHGFPDIDEYEVYTEQTVLFAPKSKPVNKEEKAHVKMSRKYIRRLKGKGWKFIISEDGTVFQDCAGDDDFFCLINDKKKAFLVNNNY